MLFFPSSSILNSSCTIILSSYTTNTTTTNITAVAYYKPSHHSFHNSCCPHVPTLSELATGQPLLHTPTSLPKSSFLPSIDPSWIVVDSPQAPHYHDHPLELVNSQIVLALTLRISHIDLWLILHLALLSCLLSLSQLDVKNAFVGKPV